MKHHSLNQPFFQHTIYLKPQTSLWPIKGEKACITVSIPVQLERYRVKARKHCPSHEYRSFPGFIMFQASTWEQNKVQAPSSISSKATLVPTRLQYLQDSNYYYLIFKRSVQKSWIIIYLTEFAHYVVIPSLLLFQNLIFVARREIISQSFWSRSFSIHVIANRNSLFKKEKVIKPSEGLSILK